MNGKCATRRTRYAEIILEIRVIFRRLRYLFSLLPTSIVLRIINATRLFVYEVNEEEEEEEDDDDDNDDDDYYRNEE